MSCVSCVASFVSEAIDRFCWNIVSQICRDIYQKYFSPEDWIVFEEEDIYPPTKVFAETVTSPFRFIVFILWLHDTYPEDAWIHFKHIKAIYEEYCTSIFSLIRLLLNLCHGTQHQE